MDKEHIEHGLGCPLLNSKLSILLSGVLLTAKSVLLKIAIIKL